ncbi:MAG TPA: riboflavin biosynthesis protein RibF [Candidatus Acetothermia bacterium]|nr:riboflavin biosynthesis protein RibF [Candidatus Acetothermia bacterium]
MNATVVTVGTFDGVHRGHQAILAEVARIAREDGLDGVAYAFPFPPRFGDSGPHLILPREVKEQLLRKYVRRIVPGEFSRVRALSPREFAARILVERLKVQAVVIGEGFRFGRGREGDPTLLAALGREYGFAVITVPPVIIAGAPVSSTRIRTLIRAGEVKEAGRLLGRPPLLTGRVVPGDRIGTKIGYPTANISPQPELVRPQAGIYLAYAFWEEGEGPGLLYIGDRPTLAGGELRFELHLLSPPDHDLTGMTIEVRPLARLRDDRKFPSITALRRQISADIATATSALSFYPKPASLLFPLDSGTPVNYP